MEYDFEPININKTNNAINEVNTNKYSNKYDITTRETYRVKRIYKIDPLTDKKVKDDCIFYFYDKWDPYTGKRSGTDPIGPLCFNPLDLYRYYYMNRCKGLWYNAENNFEGYYGELIGAGKDININSRGPKPEKYLFRLPIIDCYLPENHNYSLITYGPLLTDEEIDYLDNIIKCYNMFPLKTIKEYYDNALEKNPNIEELNRLKKFYPDKSDIDIKESYNRKYVDYLRNL